MRKSFRNLTNGKYAVLLGFFRNLNAADLKPLEISLEREEINQFLKRHIDYEIPTRTFTHYMRQLKKDGYIEKEGKFKYRITELGIEAVKTIR